MYSYCFVRFQILVTQIFRFRWNRFDLWSLKYTRWLTVTILRCIWWIRKEHTPTILIEKIRWENNDLNLIFHKPFLFYSSPWIQTNWICFSTRLPGLNRWWFNWKRNKDFSYDDRIRVSFINEISANPFNYLFWLWPFVDLIDLEIKLILFRKTYF